MDKDKDKAAELERLIAAIREGCSVCGRTGDAQRNCEWCK